MLYQKYAIALILALALSLSMLGYVILKHRQQAWLEHEFAEVVQQQVISIRHNLQQDFRILEAYAAFFSTYPQADYAALQRFSHTIRHQSDLLALHWIPRVLHEQRSAYEARLRPIDGKQQFWHKDKTLIPAPNQAEYFPILFTVPKPIRYVLFDGLDLSAEPTVAKALQYAQKTGQIYASEPFMLNQPPRPPQQIILLMQPVYQASQSYQSPQQHVLLGFVMGVFDIQKLLNNALQSVAKQNIYIRLKIPSQDKAVYIDQNQLMPLEKNRLYLATHLAVAGRRWEMQAFADFQHVHVPSVWVEAVLFLTGSFLTLLITWLFFQYFRHLDSVKKSQQKLAVYNSKLEAQLNQGSQALQESHERLKTVLNSLEAMVCVVDMQTFEVLFANKSLKQIKGIINLEGQVCWKSFYPEQSEPCSFCTNNKLLNNDGSPVGLYTWEFCNPYNKRWYLMQDRAIQWTDGRIVRLEIATDITNHKRMEAVLRDSEQYRRTLIEESTIGLMLINMDDGTFSEVNTAFANSLGYNVAEMINTMTFWELTPQQYHPITHKQQIVLKQTGRFGPYEKAYLHKEGHHVPIRLSGLLIKHKGRTFIWANVEDITYQKRAQEAEAAKVIAEQANRAKSMCLTNMSHELRTPLNAVLGYTQILSQSNNLTPEQYEGLSIIQHSSEYLLNLIDDILDISKVEAGKLELHVMDFHFDSFIKNVVDLFRVRALQKSVEFIYQPLEHPPYIVYSDEKRLRQILINLLSNAIKFTPEHGCVSLILQRVSTHTIQFKIRDTGVGIAEEEIEKIFMPFQQVGENQTEGAGLGLAITQNLVKLLNADLQVNSVLGQGTEFCVTIALPESQQTQTTPNSQIVGYQGSLKTILIADMTWEHRASLKHILSPLNFNLLEADSEETILEKLAQQPDVVMINTQLLQQQMLIPVLQSFSLIIIGDDSVTETGLHCQAIIAQPFDKKSILEHLQQILNLQWIMQKNDTEQAANMDSHFDTALISQHYPLSNQQIQHLYDLSMKGDVKGLLHFAQTLQSDKTLLPLAQHIHQLAKQLQLEHIYQIATHYQDTLQ